MYVDAHVCECGSQRSTLYFPSVCLHLYFLIQNPSLNLRPMDLFRLVTSEHRGFASLLNPRAGHLDLCHPIWLFVYMGSRDPDSDRRACMTDILPSNAPF